MDNIEDIFDEIIEEASDGINYNGIKVKFHTLDKCTLSGSYNDVPILIIKNKKEILNKLKTYIELSLKHRKLDPNKSNIKKIITLLWSNACLEDLSKPNMYIDNRINFYLNDDFLNKDIKIDNIVIKKGIESLYKETPFTFKSYINLEGEKYYLPSINYGISDDICYIYNVTFSENDEILSKRIEKKYNIILLVLSLFINELIKYGIGKIKVVSYLPMRENEKKDILDYFEKIANLYDNVIIISYPFEVDEYMNIKIYKFDETNQKKFDKLMMKE